VLYISREEVETLPTYDVCIDACEELLAMRGRGEAEEVPRIHMQTEITNIMFLPTMIKSKNIVGLRVYNIFGVPTKLMYILWSGDGTPLAMMDGMWIRDSAPER
jgi:hypothetical protein